MAAVTFVLMQIIVCLYSRFMVNSAQTTRVSISTPTSPVTIGGILAIQCQVWDTQHDFKVSIYRKANGRIVQVTNGNIIDQPAERPNVFLATRAFPGGSTTYFVTIVNGNDLDQGDYICRVNDMSKGSRIAEDSITIELYSLPAKGSPMCDSVPGKPLIVNIGDRLTLKCTSDKGVPTVHIKWKNLKSSAYLPSYETIDGNVIRSDITIDIDTSLNGAMFMCELTTEGYPDWKRTCMVGPVSLHNSLSRTNVIHHQNDFSGVFPVSFNNEKSDLAESCGECSSTNDMLEHYLTVATVGTGLLTIILIVTTIIMCHKYHSISEQTRIQPTRVLTSQQSVEPVYVSLQRRPQSTYSEREYMTLEDPNNPDNKIILPKETFDDYCRTMTLKRV